MKHQFYEIIGMMSGTSMDGIDISLVSSNGEQVIRKNNFFYEYSKEVKDFYLRLDKLSTKNDILLKKSDLDIFTTEQHYKALKKSKLLNKAEIISFHGQTILHRPKEKITIQLGNPTLLSKWTKLRTIFNFRQKDLETGGQGAPLAPIYHKIIIDELKLNLPACVINIGGIANITYWDGEKLIGFDTGPGNCLMDKYIKIRSNTYYDSDGLIASNGRPKKKFVKKFLNDSFFKLDYPKSLDKNYFNNFLYLFLKDELSVADGMATLLDCTVDTIKQSLKILPKKPKVLMIVGGGLNNNFLIKQIKNKIDIPLLNAKKTNISFDFIEAELMALLGARRLNNLPITFPSTTGVYKPISGGEIYNYK